MRQKIQKTYAAACVSHKMFAQVLERLPPKLNIDKIKWSRVEVLLWNIYKYPLTYQKKLWSLDIDN